MTVFAIDPVRDPRWSRFVERHPRASVFHTVSWLAALRDTYGYEPLAFTTCTPAQELTNGLVFCRVRSWLTGTRLVSIPFADHCDPLVDDHDTALSLLHHVIEAGRRQRLDYLEMRPLTDTSSLVGSFHPSQTFAFHAIDLRPSLEALFAQTHVDGIQRKVRRATRDGLVEEQGRTDVLLRRFYRLLIATRRRHAVPPQPIRWFEQLRDRFGENLNIRVAMKEGSPAASILTLRHRNTLVYKYGASDASQHRFGAMPFLMWNAIEETRREGLRTFDLGRSDKENAGLITFKRRLGATPIPLTYWRFPSGSRSSAGPAGRVARFLVPHIPDALLVGIGRAFYRHVG